MTDDSHAYYIVDFRVIANLQLCDSKDIPRVGSASISAAWAQKTLGVRLLLVTRHRSTVRTGGRVDIVNLCTAEIGVLLRLSYHDYKSKSLFSINWTAGFVLV